MKVSIPSTLLLVVLAAGCGRGSDAPAPETAPTVSAIADQSAAANQAGNAIAFSVSDEQVSSLSIAAASDNQNVVADAGLVLGGSGTSRTLAVTPVVDTTGVVLITITVTDSANLSASSSFMLTIEAEQLSLSAFVRSSFMTSKDDDPKLINAVEFDQDAGDDDFADLIAQ